MSRTRAAKVAAGSAILGLVAACHGRTISLGLGPDLSGSGARASTGGQASSIATGGGASSIGGSAGIQGVPETGGAAGAIGSIVGRFERVSVSSAGIQGNAESFDARLSADGRWVTFASAADDLVPDDTNAVYDVFVRDRETGTTTRVSLGPNGEQLASASISSALSSDQRWLAFTSVTATPIGGTIYNPDLVYVSGPIADLSSFTARSEMAGPPIGPGLTRTYPVPSADGNRVVYLESSDNFGDVLEVRLSDATTTRLSECEGTPVNVQGRPNVSDDGTAVVFAGSIGNQSEVFETDVSTRTCRPASRALGGGGADGSSVAPSCSADGRYVAFWSDATNLVTGDDDGIGDLFVRDMQSATTRRIDRPDGSRPALAFALSGDGRWLAFVSALTEPSSDGSVSYGLYIHDLQSGVASKLAERTGSTLYPYSSLSLSYDGRVLAFVSFEPDFVADDTNGALDVFAVELSTQP